MYGQHTIAQLCVFGKYRVVIRLVFIYMESIWETQGRNVEGDFVWSNSLANKGLEYFG